VYVFSRSGGGNIPNGNKFFLDAVMMEKGTSVSDYFDGDTIATTNNSFGWTGGVGESPSIKSNNLVDNLASSTLSRYSTTSIRATRIRWNAQENLTAIPSLSVGKTISLIYDGTTTTYRIVGIDGNVGPERYMIDYYLQKV
jgi:endonuclease YncB( thermonuclease family)